MKISIKKMLCMILAVTMVLLLAGCKSKSDTEETAGTPEESEITMEDIMEDEMAQEQDFDNGIYFDEEDDGAEIVTSKKSTDSYVGSWEATSGQAMYQFGNVDFDIKDDGTWTGNVSDEDLEGKWKETGEGIHLTSDLLDCDLVFTDNNVLVMRYSPDDDGEYLNAVLSKKQ